MSATHGNSSDPHGKEAEPKTPLWLTGLGAVLFLMVGLVWALRPDPKPEATTDAPAASADEADAGAPGGH